MSTGCCAAAIQSLACHLWVLAGLGCAKTKSDLVVMPSQIFVFFCSPHDHRTQNSGCCYTAYGFYTAWVKTRSSAFWAYVSSYFGRPAALCARSATVQERLAADRLLDHLVGAAGQRQGNADAERFGGLEVEEHFKFRRLLDRQVGGFFAFEDTPGIEAGETV